jgi:hypothetical protein
MPSHAGLADVSVSDLDEPDRQADPARMTQNISAIVQGAVAPSKPPAVADSPDIPAGYRQ